MDDNQIIDLYWSRQETAISETKKKYEKYLSSIANHILAHYEDAEESVNDTYLGGLEYHAAPSTRSSIYVPRKNHTQAGFEEAPHEYCREARRNQSRPLAGRIVGLHSSQLHNR